MSNSIGPIPYKKKYFQKNENSTHEALTVYLPKDVLRALKEVAADVQLPLSRLVNYAIDHEFERRNPFDFELDCSPTLPLFVKHGYVEEAAMILEFLKKHPRGTELDALVLMRHHIGIEDKLTFMCGYRELLLGGQIESVERAQNPNAFQHAEGVLFVKARKEPLTEFPRPKLKQDFMNENERLKAEIAKLKEKAALK